MRDFDDAREVEEARNALDRVEGAEDDVHLFGIGGARFERKHSGLSVREVLARFESEVTDVLVRTLKIDADAEFGRDRREGRERIQTVGIHVAGIHVVGIHVVAVGSRGRVVGARGGRREWRVVCRSVGGRGGTIFRGGRPLMVARVVGLIGERCGAFGFDRGVGPV